MIESDSIDKSGYNKFPNIFYDSAKGQTRQWGIKVINNDGIVEIITEYGVKDGKIQRRSRPVVKSPKGKSLTEHAHSLAESKWIDKAREHGVKVSTPESGTNKRISPSNGNINYKPMLAYDYSHYKQKINLLEYTLQPKLDGIRGIVYKLDNHVYICSRKGLDCRGPIAHLRQSLFDFFPFSLRH